MCQWKILFNWPEVSLLLIGLAMNRLTVELVWVAEQIEIQ